MKKLSLIIVCCVCLPLISMADEGMWLMNTFGQVIYPKMQKAGLKITAPDIFSNGGAPALSDAVVAVDGGMGTGSIVSAEGLMITNHHVAYGDIHALSTPEKNYLETGFWAMDRRDEIPIKGKTVTFVRRIVDVTAEGRAMYDSIRDAGRMGVFTNQRICGQIEEKYKKAEHCSYELLCVPMFKSQVYLLFYCEVYNDVRLVGAPPVSIGAFGGETDNWGWPQHKGDFALYRVYGDKQGKPANYAPDNVPIRPVRYLKVSTSGVKDGDYAMVIGFPGRTNRYKSSFAVEEKRTVTNPVVIKARRDMLDVMLAHMESDPKIRLLYADHYFSISNYADYAKWENICLRRYDVAGVRAAEEAELQRWIDASPQRQKQYGALLADLQRGYAARRDMLRQKTYYQEDWTRSSQLSTLASRLASLANNMERKEVKSVTLGDEMLQSVIANAEKNYTEIDVPTERDCLLELAPQYARNVPDNMRTQAFNALLAKFEGNAVAMFAWAVDHSMVRSLEATKEFFSTPRTREQILADPMVALSAATPVSFFVEAQRSLDNQLGFDLDTRENTYARAIYAMRMDKGIPQYPDANSTMRITYGTVGPLSPMDGVHYDSRSTIRGYMEKFDPENYEFRVDDKMRALIQAKNWGPWGADGTLYVNFLSNDDITGGNSGSPVLNGSGHLIGLAFDGNRESMAGDIYYHPKYFKTVNVDIRFVLWVIDKYAGANKLIGEMTLVK